MVNLPALPNNITLSLSCSHKGVTLVLCTSGLLEGHMICPARFTQPQHGTNPIPCISLNSGQLKAGLTLPHADDPASDPSTEGAGLPPCFCPRRSDGCGTGGGRQPPPPSDALGREAAPLAASADGDLAGSEPAPPLDADAARSHGCGHGIAPTSEGALKSIVVRQSPRAKCVSPPSTNHVMCELAAMYRLFWQPTLRWQ